MSIQKDIERQIRKGFNDYVRNTCVPKTKKNIKKLCNRGYATGNLANSVYYDKNSDKEYTVYVEAFDQYGTNYAKFADQGRREVRPVYAKVLKWSDGSYHMYSGPAKGAHFIDFTVKELQH